MVSRAIKARGQVTLTKLYDGTNGTDGKNGSDGAVGAPGADGKTTYVHVAYSSSSDGKTNFSITDPSGRSYIGVLTDFTEKDSTNPSEYTWSLVKGQDGQNGEDGAQGAPGADGKTTYVHVAYSNSADGNTDFSTTDNSGKKYIGVLTDEVEKDSTNPSDYTWSLFKGQDGQDGADGTPGKPGADGKTPYVHFAYANSADGKTDFSTTVYSNKKFIGTLTDYTIADSTDYTKYTWSLIKGADGANGTPGAPGEDGKTTYVHFAYANSADGKTDFSVTDYSNKKFIGTLTDYVIPDSTDYTKYTWSRLKGDSGVGIANTVVEYQITDTQDQPSDDSGWTSSIPNLGTGSYLWTRTTFFYTDGTTSRAYTISKQSDNTYTAVLTNDSITLPSDSTGKVTDFSNSTGNFLVYDGTYQVDPTTVKVQLVQAVNVTVTLGGNAYTITAMDSSKDTGYFDLSYTYKGVALTKRVSVSKSKSGANGTTPVIVNLSANAQVFTFDSNNHANPTSQNILFKATVSGTSSTPVYKAIPYDATGNAGTEIVMSNSGTNGKMLQVGQINDYASVVVTASVGSISDSTTIVRVKDGSSISPIPDPSNTVSSNTPPTDAKDGDWWNDTSQTPNVLKYRYRDKWVQYELDGYYVKANSISGEAIITNTLEAQKIKYTNSNGTTTNLQTFDFSGMKTLLSDTNGNTYENMETAVGSTTTVSNLKKQVNSLGQVNLINNSDFRPDLGGWNGFNTSLGTLTSGDYDYSGNNVMVMTSNSTSMARVYSAPIPLKGITTISYSFYYYLFSIPSSATVNFQITYLDKDLKQVAWANPINVASNGTGKWINSTVNGTALKSYANAVYIAFTMDVRNASGIKVGLSRPILVSGNTVGDYIPGQYSNNERILKIEQAADKFQVAIGKRVDDAQSSADTANSSINNLSVGGRNYILNSSGMSATSIKRPVLSGATSGANATVTYESDGMTIVNGSTNTGTEWYYQLAVAWQDITKTPLIAGQAYTLSLDAKGTVPQVGLRWGSKEMSPFQSLGYTNINNTNWTRATFTFTLPVGTLNTYLRIHGAINNQYVNGFTGGETLRVRNVKLESGNMPSSWTPAPEDVQSDITNAQTSADIANNNLANASKSGIRYLRFRSEGSTANASTHFSEISVYSVNGANLLSSKPAIMVGGATTSSSLTAATDGNYSTYLDLPNIANGEKYAMYDLGSVRYDVENISVAMYSSTRTYYNVTVQTSVDNVTWSTIYRGNITPNQLINGVVGTNISFGMDTSTVLKLTADNYTLGIDANGNLVSGITGNTQQVTLKGNVIHLDGNTIMDQDFFSLWNGQYGSTKIDSTGMEVATGKAKTKFTNGNMQLVSDLGENIGFIGRQVDSVYNNLDFLTFGLNGWHTTYPGDEHYDNNGTNIDQYYGGDGIIFGISNADGGYSPLLQWNSQLAANYRSAKSGWLFTQPIVGATTFYPNDMSSDSDGLTLRKMTLDGVAYPTYSSTSSDGSAGLAVGIGTSNLYAGSKRILQANSNGYMYYMTKMTSSSGVNLKMASDGAIVAQSSATKYKSDIEYELDTSHGDKLLTIDPATWSDSVQKEQIEEYNRTGKEPDYAMNKDGDRFYGLIAEDLVKAGLEDLVVRDTKTGSVEGIQYEKIGIALIPILREQRSQINELRVEIERLKEKSNE